MDNHDEQLNTAMLAILEAIRDTAGNKPVTLGDQTLSLAMAYEALDRARYAPARAKLRAEHAEMKAKERRNG